MYASNIKILSDVLGVPERVIEDRKKNSPIKLSRIKSTSSSKTLLRCVVFLTIPTGLSTLEKYEYVRNNASLYIRVLDMSPYSLCKFYDSYKNKSGEFILPTDPSQIDLPHSTNSILLAIASGKLSHFLKLIGIEHLERLVKTSDIQKIYDIFTSKREKLGDVDKMILDLLKDTAYCGCPSRLKGQGVVFPYTALGVINGLSVFKIPVDLCEYGKEITARNMAIWRVKHSGELVSLKKDLEMYSISEIAFGVYGLTPPDSYGRKILRACAYHRDNSLEFSRRPNF